MMAANLVVLLRFLLSSSICLISPVDSSLYLFNLFDTFLQLFLMMIQNRYDDGLEWHQLDGFRTGRDVEFRNVPHFIKPFPFFLIYGIAKWFLLFLFPLQVLF